MTCGVRSGAVRRDARGRGGGGGGGTARPAPLPVPAATLGEGPCWDSATGSLYWVDIEVGRVLRLDGDGAFRSWDVGQAVGAVVVRSSGGLVLAARDCFLTLDPGTRSVPPFVTLDPPAASPMNDGACDQPRPLF